MLILEQYKKLHLSKEMSEIEMDKSCAYGMISNSSLSNLQSKSNVFHSDVHAGTVNPSKINTEVHSMVVALWVYYSSQKIKKLLSVYQGGIPDSSEWKKFHCY